MRSFAQWRAWYEERAEPCIVEEGESLYFSPEHGFFYYQVLPGGVFFLDHVATDDIHWMYARAKGDDARVDAINRQQLKVARNALWAYKE